MNIETIRRDLKELGYALVDHLLTVEQLESIRIECETLREVAANAKPSSPWGATAVTSCIFETLPGDLCTSNPQLRSSYSAYKSQRSTWPLQPAVWSILFTSQLTNLVTALLGPDAVLFNDQYIVKPSHGGDAASFSWHRDSDWCRDGSLPQPYISIWIALDDCELENGCLYIRPRSHALSSEYVHIPGLEPEVEYSLYNATTTTDDVDSTSIINNSSSTTSTVPPLEGTGGTDTNGGEALKVSQLKEIPLLLSAGSAVIMTDVVEHASGANRTQYARRGWMPQFSCQPILWKESNTPVSLAIPLINK